MKLKCVILLCIDILIFMILIVININSTTETKKMVLVSNKAINGMDNAKKVALTFDDGPHPRYTQQLLDGLKERNVKVTFFVVGKNAAKYPEIIETIAKEGHLIGNHTYSHVQLNTLSIEEQCVEITKTNELLYKITGSYPQFIRPTFGEWDKKVECSMDMIPVLWSVDTLDWTTENVDKIVKKGTKNIQDGDIILMHDYYDTSVTAALQIIDKLKSLGFDFVTVDDLIL
jgi:peptidoglycan-N-acetylglucosamine deacetylase